MFRGLTGALLFVAATPVAGSADATPLASSASAGHWGPLLDWPIIPIHVVMAPDGRLLSYGSDQRGRQTGYLVYDVYDPATREHQTLPNRSGADVFCATQSIVPSTGEILISGGDQFVHDPSSRRPTLNHGSAATTVFDPADDELHALAPMADARWYGTQVVLPDGRILIAGGTDHDGVTRITVPEVWDPATRRWSALPGAAIPADDWYYPKLFVMPNGKVFGLGTTTMFVIDPDASSRDPGAWWRSRRGAITSYGAVGGTRGRGNIGFRSTAVMFEPGRILQVGGGSFEASIVDIRTGRPVVSSTFPMASGRHWPNATVLPDGTVLVTGGSSVPDEINQGRAGTVHREAERWSPATGRWTTLPAETSPRLYHSTALLLADATVMTGGGGAYLLPPGDDQARINHLDAQVFSPGYLDRGDRPEIRSSPEQLLPGEGFEVTVGSSRAIERLVLIKLPSVTHSFNNEQRSVPLSFEPGPDANSLRVTAPSDTSAATPGYYYLFAVDDAGVPSMAKIVAFATTSGTG